MAKPTKTQSTNFNKFISDEELIDRDIKKLYPELTEKRNIAKEKKDKKAAINNLKIGDIIYINRREMFTNTNDNIEPYKISKINTRSIYAQMVNSESLYAIKLDKQTIQGKAMSTLYTGYLKEKDYLIKMARLNGIKEMKTYILNNIDTLKVSQLQTIISIIDKEY